MRIVNIEVLGYETKGLQTITILNGQLSINPTSLEEAEKNIINAKGQYTLMPGLMDAHIHGYGGYDFAEATAENLPLIVKALGHTGLSYCVATLVSLDLPTLKKSLAAINNFILIQKQHPVPGETTIVGVHLEGPFIAENCKGAHNPRVLQPSINIELFKDIVRAAPDITEWKITLTPDLDGAINFIQQSKNLDVDGRKIHVHVFIGHTNASEALIEEAVAAGAIGFTHLGNANMESTTRSHCVTKEHVTSNVVKWVTKQRSQTFYVELINDGRHISNEFASFICNSVNNRILVTDALGPSGLEDGEYKLGSLGIIKQGDQFVLKDNPDKLAGSAASLASVIHTYCQNEALNKLPASELMTAIYQAAILNPRLSSLDCSIQLNDVSNFSIFNQQGQLIISCCNGQLKQFVEIPKYTYAGLFDKTVNRAQQADESSVCYTN